MPQNQNNQEKFPPIPGDQRPQFKGTLGVPGAPGQQPGVPTAPDYGLGAALDPAQFRPYGTEAAEAAPKAAEPFTWPGFLRGMGGDIAIGAGKQAAKILDAPYRMLTGKEPLEWMEPDPYSAAQNLGAYGLETASFLAGAGPTRKLDTVINQMTKNWPWMAAWAGRVTGRAATGAVSNALIARLNELPPENAAIIGAGFNALPAIFLGKGEVMRDSAITSMMRAMQPSTNMEKAAAMEVSEVLVDDFTIWARNKGFQKIAQKHVDMYMREMDDFIARSGLREGGGPGVRMGDLESRISLAAQREFQPGTRAITGEAMSLSPTQERAYNKVLELMERFVRPQAGGAPGMQEAWTMPFTAAEATKRAMQADVGRAGGFLEALAQEPRQAELLAQRVIATATKETLERIAQDQTGEATYGLLNDAIHTWITARDIAKKTTLREVGQVIPLAERPALGFGAAYSPSLSAHLPGMAIRMARGYTGTPLYQTTVAALKNELARPMQAAGTLPRNRLLAMLWPTPERHAAIGAMLGAEMSEGGLPEGVTVDMQSGDIFYPEEEEKPEETIPRTKVRLSDPLGIRRLTE